jgi:hypothetical protein
MRVITFEDQGQDFLTWTIDETGLVVDCKPFQGFVWCGCTVMNNKGVRAGANVWVYTKQGQALCMKYKAISVKKAKP